MGIVTVPTAQNDIRRVDVLPAGTRRIFGACDLRPCGGGPEPEKRIVAITPKQRAYLKSLAHHLKPVAFVGKEGLSDATIRSVEEALSNRELIKVKVLEASPSNVREAGAELEQRIAGAELVQTIGRIAVLYRPHPEKPQIELP